MKIFTEKKSKLNVKKLTKLIHSFNMLNGLQGMLLIIFCSIASNVQSQTTVFSENFNVSNGTNYTNTAGLIGTSTTWYMNKSGSDWGAKINPTFLDLTNDVDGTTNLDGWVFGYTPVAGFSAPYNATLSSNAGIVSWSFNLRTNRTVTALAGFNTITYGIAMILACTSTSPNTSGNGYAVVMGGGTNNNIGLIYFTGGLQGTKTTIISYGGVTPASLNNYMSVQVSYDPSNHLWWLADRDDGNSAFSDPSTGIFTQVGTGTNSTGTNTAMPYMGAYWQGSTLANQTCFIDNIVVSEVIYSNYYSKATGNLQDLSNWGTNTDGTGSAPINFTDINQVFNIRNNATPTIGAAWVVSGTNSKIIIGDDTNPCNFTIPSNYAVSAYVDMANAGSFTLQNSSYPTFGALASNSTIIFDGATSQTINAGSYSNITIQNSSAAKVLGGNITLGNNNTFTVASGVTLTAGTNTISFGTNGNGVVNGIFQTANSAGFSGTAFTSFTNTNSPNISIGSSSTILYNGSSTQTITGGTFANIQLSNSAAIKNASSNITLGNSNTFTLDTGVTFNASTYRINFGTGGIANISGIFQTANIFGGCFSGTTNATIVSTNTPTINLNTGSTVEYTSTSAQTISTANSTGTSGTLTYYHLLISGITGTKTFSSSPKIAAGGSFTLNTNCIADLGATKMTFLGSGSTININGTIITQKAVGGISGLSTSTFDNTNNPTINFGATSTVVYNSVGANQLVANINYANLTIAGSGNKNLGGNATVSGLLTLSNKLAIGGNNTLTLNGTFTGNDTNSITGSATSNLVITGVAKTLYFDQTSLGTSNLLRNLTITGSNTTTLGNALNISGGSSFGSVTVGTGATLASGGNLTLKSDALGTACIGNSAGNISGNVTVERYVSGAGRRYRFLSSPVQSQTIANWMTQFYVTGPCTSAPASLGGINDQGWHASQNNINNPGAYHASTNPFGVRYTSIRTYDESVSGSLDIGFTDVTPSTALTAGKGFKAYIRGPIGNTGQLNGTVAGQSSVTLALTGNVNQGEVNSNIIFTSTSTAANDGWNLLGNPYPCGYDFNAQFDANNSSNFLNVNNTVYVYDATSNGYKSYNASSNAGNLSNGIIPSGSGFFVQSNAINPVFKFQETFKSVTAPIAVHKSISNSEFTIKYFRDSTENDEIILKMLDGATLNKDDYDINKLRNENLNLSTYGEDENELTLSVIPPVNGETRVKLNVEATLIGHYHFNFTDIHHFDEGVSVKLLDKFTNKIIDVKANPLYTFEMDAGINQWGKNRFEIILNGYATTGHSDLMDKPQTNAKVLVSPNPAADLLHIKLNTESSLNSLVQIYTISGVEVCKTIMKQPRSEVNISHLQKGMYLLKISNEHGLLETMKFVKD